MTTTREVHTGVVTDNEDPEKRFRLKIASATLMGTDDDGEAVEFGDWIEPCFPALLTSDGETVTGGFFMVPSPGATVEIEISESSSFDESPGQTGIYNPNPRWRSALFQSADDIPAEFAKNYPRRFGFRSATGHVFYFDDSAGAEGKIVVASRPGDDDKQSLISLTNDGSIQIITRNGMMIFMNADSGEVTILDSNKNMFAMKPDGITIADTNGSTIDMNASGVNILAKGNLFLQGNSITLKALKIALGDELATLPVMHTAPPGTPSTLVFVKV